MRFHLRSVWAILLLSALALNGCDNAIDVPPSQAGRYTLWGALDPTTDIQSVRVVRVADTLAVRTAERLPITVMSTNLATGVETPWRDSLVTFRDGSVGHVFGARLRPAYGSRHRLVVRRDADGGEVTAETQVPPAVVPVLLSTDLSQGARAPISWSGAPQLSPLRVTYYVQKYNVLRPLGFEPEQRRPPCELDTATFVLPPDPGRVAGGWLTRIDYFQTQTLLDDTFREKTPEEYLSQIPAGGPTDRRFQVGLRKIHVATDALSADWRPPGDVFDFETMAAPEAFGNVRGGYGFVGAGFRSGFTFRPAQADLNRVGFFNTQPVCPSVPEDLIPFPPTPGPLPPRSR